MNVLLVNQAFYPDTVATGQYLSDLAADLAAQKHKVTVLSGAHGYDDPSKKFLKKETWKGVRIRRIAYSIWGKKGRFSRAVDFAAFHLGLLWRLIWTPRQDVVVGLTSPPLVAVSCLLFCKLKGVRFIYWVMDMNPDEAIAAGWLKEYSLVGRLLSALSGWSFRKSDRIVVLDRFMKMRIERRYKVDPERIRVLPPWTHDDTLKPIPNDQNAFRHSRGLNDKFVVMYSGNHSPCHPLGTLLGAARALKDDPTVVFYFIGGGSLVPSVSAFKKKHSLTNIVQLPYQPKDVLSESLSAGDLHVVVMGEPFVGIVHPCKVYGILSVGRPFVFIGPEEGHMADLIRESSLGYPVHPNDVEGLLRVIEKVRRFGSEEKDKILKESLAFQERFSYRDLAPRLIRILEETHAKNGKGG